MAREWWPGHEFLSFDWEKWTSVLQLRGPSFKTLPRLCDEPSEKNNDTLFCFYSSASNRISNANVDLLPVYCVVLLIAGKSTCVDVSFDLERLNGSICFAELWMAKTDVPSSNKSFTSGHMFVVDRDTGRVSRVSVRQQSASRTSSRPWFTIDLSRLVSAWSDESETIARRNLSVCWSRRKSELARFGGPEEQRLPEVKARFDRLRKHCRTPTPADSRPFLVVGRLASRGPTIGQPRSNTGETTDPLFPMLSFLSDGGLPQLPTSEETTERRRRRDVPVRRIDGELIQPKSLNYAQCATGCRTITTLTTLLLKRGQTYNIFTTPVPSSCSC